jgi:hypothetical protein
MLYLLNGCDSRDFWKSCGKIGIANDRKQRVAMGTVNKKGDFVSDCDVVLDKWKSDYKQLYSESPVLIGLTIST